MGNPLVLEFVQRVVETFARCSDPGRANFDAIDKALQAVVVEDTEIGRDPELGWLGEPEDGRGCKQNLTRNKDFLRDLGRSKSG